MPTNLVTKAGQMSLDYATVEYIRYAPESYYVVTDRYVYHYTCLCMIGYDRQHKSAVMREEYWQERKRAEKGTRCPKSEVEQFATVNGWNLIVKPFSQ